MKRRSRAWIVLQLLSPRLRASYDAPEKIAALVLQNTTVVAAPFNSFLKGGEPDLTNRKIAEIAFHHMRPGSIFIGQWEQACLLRNWSASEVIGYGIGGERVQTQELLRWVAEQVSKKCENNNILLVGHPHHLWRLSTFATFYGLNPRIIPQCEEVPYDPRQRPGYHFWATLPWRYFLWEYLLARPKHILDAFLGKL